MGYNDRMLVVHDAIQSGLSMSQAIVEAYLGGLSDSELLIRPLPACNHIAWQLGHCIMSENGLIERVLPGRVGPVSAKIGPAHRRTAAPSDDSADFLDKDEYLDLMRSTRSKTLEILASLSDEELARPVEGKLPPGVKTVADAFIFVGVHWLMHAGQWAVIRRRLGRPPLV